MVIERRFQDIHSNFLEIVVNKKGIKFGSDFFFLKLNSVGTAMQAIRGLWDGRGEGGGGGRLGHH